MITNKEYLDYWESIYFNDNFFGTGPTKLAKYAEKLLADKKVESILEIGCGQGRDALFFASLGYKIKAFDISNNAIDFVNRKKNEFGFNNLDVIVQDTSKDFRFRDEEFDFIYSNLALQFFDLPTMNNIFGNVHRVLKKGGMFLFSTKKEGDKYYRVGRKINEHAYETKGVTRYFFSAETIKNTLVENFELVEMEEDKHTNLDSTVSVWWKILASKK